MGTNRRQSGPQRTFRKDREERTTLKYAVAITLFFIGGMTLFGTLKDFKRVFNRSRFDEIAA
jgi:hypothetical protein